MWASEDQTCHTPLPASACGVERWRIKTGADTGASEIDPTQVPTTVAALVGFVAPATTNDLERVGTVERTTYVMDATITDLRMTEDSDYHVVVTNPAGQTMIVEIPHPDCVSATSPLRAQISAARQSLNTTFKISSSFRSVNVAARITGIGFWDDIHGQRGVAANGIELHPVTAISANPTTPLPQTPTVQVIEYYSKGTDSYFLTGRAYEKALLDGLPTLFSRTGMQFSALSSAGTTPGVSAICRYFYKDTGINSTHFYGAGSDCPLLKTTATTNALFHDEGFDFTVGGVAAKAEPVCPTSAPFPIYRGFRQGTASKTSNHRYSISQATYDSAIAAGYLGEGIQYCTTSSQPPR